jgi:glycosyltransferase involved in cell wall biosynthesis
LKRILVIPHSPSLKVKVRSLELARQLAQKNCVFYLTWSPYTPPSLQKIWQEVRDFFFPSVKKNFLKNFLKDIHLVKISSLYRPQKIMNKYNCWQLGRLIKKHKIEMVISANTYYYPVPHLSGGKYIYDLVDDHLSICAPKTKEYTQRFIKTEIKKANQVITITSSLARLIEKQFQRRAKVIPNGVDLKKFASFPPRELEKIKEKYQLKNKFVIGYIGYHGEWSGLDFLIEVFQRLSLANSCLFIVGGGEEVEKWLVKNKDERIIFTGPISPEKVHFYFKVIDLGVLPFISHPFTEHSFPLKVLEYGAAEKIVISTPLKELARANLPYIVLTERKVEAWVQAILKTKTKKWSPEWRNVLQKYDWREIGRRLKEVLEE